MGPEQYGLPEQSGQSRPADLPRQSAGRDRVPGRCDPERPARAPPVRAGGHAGPVLARDRAVGSHPGRWRRRAGLLEPLCRDRDPELLHPCRIRRDPITHDLRAGGPRPVEDGVQSDPAVQSGRIQRLHDLQRERIPEPRRAAGAHPNQHASVRDGARQLRFRHAGECARQGSDPRSDRRLQVHRRWWVDHRWLLRAGPQPDHDPHQQQRGARTPLRRCRRGPGPRDQPDRLPCLADESGTVPGLRPDQPVRRRRPIPGGDPLCRGQPGVPHDGEAGRRGPIDPRDPVRDLGRRCGPRSGRYVSARGARSDDQRPRQQRERCDRHPGVSRGLSEPARRPAAQQRFPGGRVVPPLGGVRRSGRPARA